MTSPLRQSLRDTITVVMSLMITTLFLVWVVFGSTTVSKQNQAILEGVRQELINQQHDQQAANRVAVAAFLHQQEEQRNNLRAVVCILSINPDARTDSRVNDCLVKNHATIRSAGP